jgi:uncharacterized membrane protein
MSAMAIARLLLGALFGLQLAWHGWIAPPTVLPQGFVLALAAGPLAIPLIGLLLRWQQAMFMAALLALLYFCHGVMEAWAAPEVRVLAVIEVLLSSALIGFAGWPSWRDGMARRRAKRAAAAARGDL